MNNAPMNDTATPTAKPAKNIFTNQNFGRFYRQEAQAKHARREPMAPLPPQDNRTMNEVVRDEMAKLIAAANIKPEEFGRFITFLNDYVANKWASTDMVLEWENSVRAAVQHVQESR